MSRTSVPTRKKRVGRAVAAVEPSPDGHADLGAIDLIDELDEKRAQAIAIATLLMDADADGAIQNAAWAMRTLTERAKAIGQELFRMTSRLK